MSDANSDAADHVIYTRHAVVGRKSWVEYVGAIITYGIYGAVVYGVTLLIGDIPSPYVYGLYGLVAVLFVYRWMVIRSYKISLDEQGIWMSYGILPWAKGANGIRWTDFDMPKYTPTFLSWITNSYTVTIPHRFTNSTDFSVSNIWRARVVCRIIDDEHARWR